MHGAVLYKTHTRTLILRNIPAVHFGFECLVEHYHHAVHFGDYSFDKSAVPLLKCFLHDCMVGVVEHLLRRFESLVKLPALVTHYHTDKLRQSDNGMSIVHLNAIVIRKILHRAENRLMLSDKIGNCGSTEEVFLLQSEYLSCLCFVIGIKYTGNVLGGTLLFSGFGELTAVEQVKVELIIGFSLPESQSAYILSAVSDNGIVVGNCVHIAVSEVYHNRFLLTTNAPRVAVSLPIVCGFGLESVLDALLEQTVLIAYSVAVQRKIKRCRTVQEASRKSAQTAVTESGVLDLLEFGYIHTERFQLLSCAVKYSKTQQVVVYCTAHQKLHREIACLACIIVSRTALVPHGRKLLHNEL